MTSSDGLRPSDLVGNVEGQPHPVYDARILIVDDHDANVALLERFLHVSGFTSVYGVTNSSQAVALCLELQPSLLLLDLHMPKPDGHDILAELSRTLPDDTFLPVLVLTGDVTSTARERALDSGAKDFLTKPFDRVEVIQRVRNLLETQALYQRVHRHNAELQAELDRQVEDQRRAEINLTNTRRRVEGVLQSDALRMVYQPIVDLQTSAVVGVEALARFDCEPARGPDHWFAEASEAGLGIELELAAVNAAIAAIDQLPSGVWLSVNVSPATAMSSGLVEALSRVAGTRIVLELTEHTRVESYPLLVAALDELRHQGVRIAVDDAGAGYAGLQQILGLRPDLIKLDVEVTTGIDADPIRRALAASLVRFGRDTGAVIVAEGVETGAELATLRDLEVSWGQGYHLARPGPLPIRSTISLPPASNGRPESP
jgi:EAL domain-containing protein (putative c-di-GMP-specific phosphodiesterase class I)